MTEHNVSIEVVVSWGGNPLDTALVSGERGLHIGPSADAWMTLPSELLATDHALVAPSDDGWVLDVPNGAEIRVARGGRAIGLEEVALGGGSRLKLEAGMTAEVRLGAFAFFVRPTATEADRTPKTAGGYRWMRWLAVAAVLHGIFLVMFALTPSNSAALNLDDRGAMTRYVQVSLAADATETPVLPPAPVGESGGSSSDSAGSLGGGDSVAVAEGGSPAPVRAGRRTPSFVVSQDNVTDVGPLAVLRASLAASFGDGSSPFTAGSAQEGDGGLATGRLLLPGGPGFGALDMGNTGRGTCDPRHQNCTAGMVGVGDLDTHGDPGHGHSVGLHQRDHVGGVPPIPTPLTDTTGALSPEQIRRVVRRHVNEVRFCYEQGLQSRPDLEGRVAVSFIIGSDGAVDSATVSSNTLGNDRVGGCVQQAVRRWTFPSSEGATGVTYPFLMQSAN